MAYTGQVAEIPIGFDGLTGSKNQTLMLPSELVRAQSITYAAGTLSKEGGAEKYNAVAIPGAPAIVGGWDWWPALGVQRMIVLTSAGTLLRDDGAATFPVTLASGLSVHTHDFVPQFVEAGNEAVTLNKKLFVFTGRNAVQVIDGDAAVATPLASPPADWNSTAQPRGGFLHEGRLTGFGGTDPHRWYLSLPTNHEDFTTTPLQFAIFPGEGEGLVAGFSFGHLAVLLKSPGGIYLVDTSSIDTDDWTVRRLTTATGLKSPLGWAFCDSDVMYLDAQANFQLLSSVTEFGDVSSRNLGQVAQMAEFFRTQLTYAGLPDCRAIYYAARREVHFSVRRVGSSQNDARLIVDLNRPDRPRWHFSPRDIVRSMWLRRDLHDVPRPVVGDAAGFVWELDQETRSKDGAGYEALFESAPVDLGTVDAKFSTIRKAGDFLELVVEPKGNWNLTVDYLWDDVRQGSVSFSMGAVTGSALGSFVLGTSALGGESVRSLKRRITGSGRRFALIGRLSGAGEDFSIAKFYLHFRPLDERL